MKIFTWYLLLLLWGAAFLQASGQQVSPFFYSAAEKDRAIHIAAEKATFLAGHKSITVPETIGEKGPGDDCSQAVAINVPGDLPYSILDNTTCGHGNVYDPSCMQPYSGGEDFIYRLDVSQESMVEITMTPATEWTGMGLFDDCPDVGACLEKITFTSVGYQLEPMTIRKVLDPGSYYIMIDSWPEPACFNFSFSVKEFYGVNTFPYIADFEDGTVPQELGLSSGDESDVGIDADAAMDSDYGLLMEGGTAYAWGITPNNQLMAFDPSKEEHFANCQIEVIPTGQSGELFLEFDLRQGYSYTPNYSWLRVLVNGSVVPDINGYTFYQPQTHTDPFTTHRFDLSGFQDDQFSITVRSSCKYHKDYYQQGDIACIDNIKLWYQLPPGLVQGFVSDINGNPVENANIAVEGGDYTQTQQNGYYLLENVENGYQNVIAWKNGYNPDTNLVVILSGDTSESNHTLTNPLLSLTPLVIEEYLNPDEYFESFFTLINYGSGQAYWEAEKSYHDLENNATATLGNIGWLDLGSYSGNIQGNGDLVNVPVYIDASGMQAGEVYHADITITSWPETGGLFLPVHLYVSGPALTPVSDFSAILDDESSGKVLLSWTHISEDFRFFQLFRNGNFLTTTTNTSLVDYLPDYGEYAYTIRAVYDEGNTVFAGPDTVLWGLSEMVIQPDVLVNKDFILPNQPVHVYTEIRNTGIAPLEFEFPGFSNKEEIVNYCDASGGCGEYISRVRINAIDNPSDCSGYADYTNISTTMQHGNSYTLQVDVGNPFSGDMVFIWVDWDQDGEFYDELTIVPSGSPFSGFTAQIVPPANAINGLTRMRIRLQWDGTPAPCGYLSLGEVEDYSILLPGSFIQDVQPSEGMVQPGGSEFITVTFDGTGYPPGKYYEPLLCESNDPGNLQYILHDTLVVVPPAAFAGTVTDEAGNQGVAGVLVAAGERQTISGSDGSYLLYVNEGHYDVVFKKVGFQSFIVEDTFSQSNDTSMINVTLAEFPDPPEMVLASVVSDDSECLVEWDPPSGSYEILYDDGKEEELALWAEPGGENAVKFTPEGYPATVIGGKLYVGNGSFPAGNWLGSPLSVKIYDDDGPNGFPGTLLDEINITVDNYEWIEFWELEANIGEGDFYISMKQEQAAPAAPLGVDYSHPVVYRSFSRMPEGEWTSSVYQDFMLRAYVQGPSNDIKNNSSLSHYQLARVSDFDPLAGPAAGILEFLQDSISATSYLDSAYQTLQKGWYAYAARANYPGEDVSDWTFSNVVPHQLDAGVEFNVLLSKGNSACFAEVSLSGEDYPFDFYTGITDSSGYILFDSIIAGTYLINVFKPGFDPFFHTDLILEDTNYSILLGEIRFPPRNLYVDPLTSLASWDWPIHSALYEDFESEEFPPPGWQSLSMDIFGWIRTDNGTSGDWVIPPWDSHYACVNDAMSGSVHNGCCDYLVTPAIDLRDSEDYKLHFDSYYDGLFGQVATVEYSLDTGNTWDVLYTLPPKQVWYRVEIDLSPFCNSDSAYPVWIAFHSDDNMEYGSGWAVDNVEISTGNAHPRDFLVYLDGIQVASTDTNRHFFAGLTYGVEYEVAVAARYTSGLSSLIHYSFISEYLIPPQNLDGFTVNDSVQLWWEPPLTPAWMQRVGQEERLSPPDETTDYSPFINKIEIENNQYNRDQWDVQFNFPVAIAEGESGLETDGQYLYSTKWNGNEFYKYDLQGNFLESFLILGSGNIRDLAYNSNSGYMAGGSADDVCYIMNFSTHELVSVFAAPTEIRAIAYDPVEDGYWANNWSSDITLFDHAGSMIASFPVGAFGNFYGFAYDHWTDDGPFLWGFSQDNSGAVLVQIDIGTGAQVFSMDVLPLVGGSQIAGGLFTECSLIENNMVTLGGTLQNERIFGLELGPCNQLPGPGGIVPGNFLGYNLYRDSLKLAWLPYQGEDTTYFLDTGLVPSTYHYQVTGVYDLALYGFIGDTAESAYAGPFEAVVEYGFPLPFKETWYSGNFEENAWDYETNWSVSSLSGNPEPAAEFNWFPILPDYRSSIKTWYIDGKNIDDPFIDGCIWMDFEVSLVNRNATGDEFLYVEVGVEGNWTRLLTLDNSSGNIDWRGYHLNLSPQAFGRIFNVRFVAKGRNSGDIEKWLIDNIYIYRTCPSVHNLTVEEIYTGNTIEAHLSWEPPLACSNWGQPGNWIHWDNGLFEGGIGLTGGGTFLVAARWDPDMISNLDGKKITHIRFIPNNDAVNTQFTLKIWRGENAGIPVYEQEVDNLVYGAWNNIVLDIPVPVDVTRELWIGYEVSGPDGEHPAGHDAGPAIVGYGDMISFDGVTWDPVSSFGLQFDKNWSIRALVVNDYGETTPLPGIPKQEILTENSTNQLEVVPSSTPIENVSTFNVDRAVTGYNIYRDAEFLDYTQDTFYVDYLNYAGVYEYQVEAVFEDCISDTLPSVFVKIVTGLNELPRDSILIYPIPAYSTLFIQSGEPLLEIIVLDNNGQQMHRMGNCGMEHQIDVSDFPSGVYFVRLVSNDRIHCRKVIVTSR